MKFQIIIFYSCECIFQQFTGTLVGYPVLKFISTEGYAPAVRYLVLSDSAFQEEQGMHSTLLYGD